MLNNYNKGPSKFLIPPPPSRKKTHRKLPKPLVFDEKNQYSSAKSPTSLDIFVNIMQTTLSLSFRMSLPERQTQQMNILLNAIVNQASWLSLFEYDRPYNEQIVKTSEIHKKAIKELKLLKLERNKPAFLMINVIIINILHRWQEKEIKLKADEFALAVKATEYIIALSDELSSKLKPNKQSATQLLRVYYGIPPDALSEKLKPNK